MTVALEVESPLGTTRNLTEVFLLLRNNAQQNKFMYGESFAATAGLLFCVVNFTLDFQLIGTYFLSQFLVYFFLFYAGWIFCSLLFASKFPLVLRTVFFLFLVSDIFMLISLCRFFNFYRRKDVVSGVGRRQWDCVC